MRTVLILPSFYYRPLYSIKRFLESIQKADIFKLAIIPYDKNLQSLINSTFENIEIEFFDQSSKSDNQLKDINPVTNPIVLINNYSKEIIELLLNKGYQEDRIITLELLYESYLKDIDRLNNNCLHRNIRWISEVFKCTDNLTLAASNHSYEYYKGFINTKTQKLIKYERSIIKQQNDIVIFMPDENNKIEDDPSFFTNNQVYILDKNRRLLSNNLKTNSFENPHSHMHIFNKIGNKLANGGFSHFPYGYIFRWPLLGPVNEFGFRINQNLKTIQNRDSNNKLIAIFGGSAAYSIYCLHDEMFSYRLETMLNQYCKENSISYRFTVLNFGMCSHVVMNEILTYILFCQILKPDYVIAHDGNNDLCCGMVSDPFLLKEHKITYTYEMEDWSQLLHETKDISKTQPEKPFKIINLPQNIFSAYVERKQQFQNLVESQGGVFIWGLQPLVYGKKRCPLKNKSIL